jgi:hypothetical protein
MTALLPVATYAQTKKRSTTKTRARTTTSAAQKTAEAVHNGASSVADQIKNLTHFLYLLGGVTKGIEQSEVAIRRKEASPAIIDTTEKSKATVRSSFKEMRAHLDKLEADFRLTPELEPYFAKLTGVANDAATAEDQAAASQFDQAGRTLLGVVNHLTDVLLEMGGK